MKKFIKPLIYSFGLLFILTLIITLFNYIGILSRMPLKIFKIIIPIISYFISGFIIGKKSNKKGWLSGIELGIMITTILILLNLLFNTKTNIKLLLFYGGLIIISTLGSILGINKKMTN